MTRNDELDAMVFFFSVVALFGPVVLILVKFLQYILVCCTFKISRSRARTYAYPYRKRKFSSSSSSSSFSSSSSSSSDSDELLTYDEKMSRLIDKVHNKKNKLIIKQIILTYELQLNMENIILTYELQLNMENIILTYELQLKQVSLGCANASCATVFLFWISSYVSSF